jgi:uncharacterized protein (TIGR03086 family)
VERKRIVAIDWLETQRAAHRAFGERLAGVRDWSASTPDREWDVRALVSHVIEEQQWVPLLLDGRSVAEARARLDPPGDDLVAAWRRYSAAAAEAWQGRELGASVRLSSDTVTVMDYLREQVSDVIIHTWDLARAVGDDELLDDDLVEAAWTVFEPQQDTLQASGLYDFPVPVADDEPLQTRLLALTGRDARQGQAAT